MQHDLRTPIDPRCLRAEVERVRALPVREAARAVIALLVELHRWDADLHGVLAAAERPGASLEALATARLRETLGERPDEIRAVDPEIASFILARTVEALVHGTARREPERLRDPRFGEEVAELVVRYLEP